MSASTMDPVVAIMSRFRHVIHEVLMNLIPRRQVLLTHTHLGEDQRGALFLNLMQLVATDGTNR